MIVYYTMFLYIYVIGVLGNSYVKKYGTKRKYNNGTNMLFAVLILVLPVIFIGLRTNYVDTKGYIAGFESLPLEFSSITAKFENSRGPGWLVYQWIIKAFITKNPNTFLLVTAIIQAGALMKFYYKYSSDYMYSMLLFFLSMTFASSMMNGIRQYMAVTLILYFADYIFDKKYLKFLVVVLLAYSIHNSAIIWAVAVFIVQGKPWNKKVLICIALAVAAIMFLDRFTSFLEEGLSDTNYAGYTQQFTSDNGSNPIHTLIYAVPIVIAFWKRNQIAELNNRTIDILINVSILAFALSLVANFTSGILIGRMPVYFSVFSYALFPLMFDNVFNEKDKRIFKVLCGFGYLCYAIYYMYNAWGDMGMPYISDVLGIDTWH
ncbi:MAG: EpsG family protein [Clostridia bacterium]|nr:EpsG family protein [Clostridia bacterium]